MTLEEISTRFEVSLACLQAFERAGFINVREEVYDEDTLQTLSHLLSLKKLGMDMDEIASYVSLEKQGNHTLGERKHMLQEKRKQLLSSIHKQEQSITCLDYVYYELCAKNT